MREIGESYFRMRCFQFDDEIHLMAKSWVTDQWKLGFLSAAFIFNVGFSVNCQGDEFERIELVKIPRRVNNNAWD
jgi:hypothetical protein